MLTEDMLPWADRAASCNEKCCLFVKMDRNMEPRAPRDEGAGRLDVVGCGVVVVVDAVGERGSLDDFSASVDVSLTGAIGVAGRSPLRP